MSKEFESTRLHTDCKYDFDFLSDQQIISVGQDKLLYVYDCLLKERITNSELDVEMSSIAVHPANRKVFAIGGKNQVVQSYDNQELIGGLLIQNFQGEIHRIVYSMNGIYLGMASEENTLTIFNQDTQSNAKCRPGHEAMTLNVCFDPLGRFVISIGCDGQAFLYQLRDPPQIVKRYKISKDVTPNGIQQLQADWHPSGKWVAVPGQMNLQLIKIEEDPEDLTSTYLVSHSKEISIIHWANEATLITVGCDKIVKLWHFKNEKDIDLVWQNNFDQPIIQARVNPSKTMLYVADITGNLHWSTLDCDALKMSEQVNKKTKIYEQKYSTTENALQDLLQKKVRPTAMDEEILSDEADEVQVEEMQLPVVKATKKEKSSKINADDIIDIQPQNLVHPTRTDVSARGITDRRFLVQNYIGSVKSSSMATDDDREDHKNRTFTIEVEFFDKNFHQMMKFDNEDQFEMAAMNYRGLILASKGPNNRDVDNMGYINDNDKPSRIYYQAFHKEVEVGKFLLDLPNNEGAESVAIGNDWFSVITDIGVVHIMGFSGVELHSFTMMKPLVAMSAYEHLLVIAYLDSPPIFGCHVIKAYVYNVELLRKVEEIDVMPSLFSDVQWFGYSEDGLLMMKDSKHAIWAYVHEQCRWVQVNSGKEDPQFWMFAANEYTYLGYKLDPDTTQPDAAQTPLPVIENFQIAVLSAIEPVLKNSEEVALLEFQALHEQYRLKTFYHLNHARTRKNHPLIKYQESLWDQKKFIDHEKQINRLKLIIFRDLYARGEEEKMIEYFKTHAKTQTNMNTFMALIESKVTNEKLKDRFRKVHSEKIRILSHYGEQQESQSNLIEDLKGSHEIGTKSYGLLQPKQNLNLQNLGRSQQPTVEPPSEPKQQQPKTVVEQPSIHHSSYMKQEDKPKANPFTKVEQGQAQTIFQHVEQQDENNKKRKLIAPSSQLSFGQSNLNGKKRV